jgi:dopamine beta-monooxygenase
MGASTFVFPEFAGGVIGGPNYSPYLVLEVHYDNPNLKANIIDSSGLRIYYQGGKSEPLRKYDAGIMEIGLEYNPKNSIPPKMNNFHLHGYCLSECTQAALPSPQGITVFASQLHTHLTGRRVWTSLIRNNKVIDILNSDNHYDQMFQEIRLLRKPIRVRPGDALVNTCVYETLDRTNMTFGGYGIRDEMCVNYMHYYPASQLEVCKSSIRDDILTSYFDTMKIYDLANTSSQYSIEENFNSIRWTPLTSSILSKLYDISPLSFSCNSSDGKHIEKAYVKSNNYFEALDAEDLRSKYAPLDKDINEECFPDIM